MKRKILSIGPNNSMNYLIKTIVAEVYHLIIVNDVFKGIYLLRQKHEIDLVIIDIDYHTKETMDFLLHIFSSKLYNQSLIAISNSENKKNLDLFMKENKFNYFLKPFNPVQLLNCINEIMVSVSKSNVLKQ